VLRSRILQIEMKAANRAASQRAQSHGRLGDRSEKIRTDNFPQTVSPNHDRIHIHQLEAVMQTVKSSRSIEAMTQHYQAEKLEAGRTSLVNEPENGEFSAFGFSVSVVLCG